MTAYGFNENDAKRIGRAVRAVERDPTKVRLGGPSDDGAAPGVRLLIAKHDGVGWGTGAEAMVTIYNGDPGGEIASVATVMAYNHYIEFSSDPHLTSRWVALGHNGFAWHPVDAMGDCKTCISLIGGVDFRVFSNYHHTAVQMLGHDPDGCVRWYDIATCATAS